MKGALRGDCSRVGWWRAALVTLGLVVSAAGGAQGFTGLVLMHGKGGSPASPALGQLAYQLLSDGVSVVRPEMPWSGARMYDAGYDDAMRQIESAVAELRKAGARRVFVGGHSFGANAAIGYAAWKDDADGIVPLAIGHVPESDFFRSRLGSSVARAKRLVAEGKGEQEDIFDDINQGQLFRVRAKASAYASLFDPEGRAAMSRSAAAFKRAIPVLMVMGRDDPLFGTARRQVFDRMPPHPRSRYVEIRSNHANTPADATAEVRRWLKELGE